MATTVGTNTENLRDFGNNLQSAQADVAQAAAGKDLLEGMLTAGTTSASQGIMARQQAIDSRNENGSAAAEGHDAFGGGLKLGEDGTVGGAGAGEEKSGATAEAGGAEGGADEATGAGDGDAADAGASESGAEGGADESGAEGGANEGGADETGDVMNVSVINSGAAESAGDGSA